MAAQWLTERVRCRTRRRWCRERVPRAPARAGDRRHLDARRSSRSTDDGPARVRAGQFNMLYAFGAGEVPISISGDPPTPSRSSTPCAPSAPRPRRSARRSPGEVLGVRGPFGSSWPVGRAQGRRPGDRRRRRRPGPAAAGRATSARQARTTSAGSLLLYGGREPEQLLYRGRARTSGHATRARGRASRSTAPAATGRATWGSCTTLIARARVSIPAHAVALLCGPEVMMRFSARALVRSRGRRRTASTSRWSAT